MKKFTVKMILDLLMVIVFSLMFNKMVLGLTFHEAGGLALGIAVLVHLILNRKWVIGVTQKMFGRKLPVKTRIGYFLNFVLLICFGLIIYSGIQISKVLFTSNAGQGGNFKNIHVMSSYIALIVVGLHIGLHYEMIKKFFINRLPVQIRKGVTVVLTLFLTINGAYQLSQSNIIMMFGAGGEGARPEMHSEQMIQSSDNQSTNNGSEGPPTFSDNSTEFKPEGRPEGGDHGEVASISISNVLSVFIKYFSIAGLFAVISAFIDAMFKRHKPRYKLAIEN